ncbi:Phakinin [Saguinus oedipus]|uniref:Phakinin n=1 Tax=Saguinus oedipus TaxID=9490 RepID=A0ABQ9TZT9_SAGOE|nr:Phakinin [Saguinus oedipus]
MYGGITNAGCGLEVTVKIMSMMETNTDPGCTAQKKSGLRKRGLENTLHDAKHWHDMELQNLGAVVGRLEAELSEIRAEAEQQQQERAHLLARKCQLQKDVASYHALLDREESG